MKTTAIIADGPIKTGTCKRCGCVYHHDIFNWHGMVLCGDCRYWERHGKVPPRESHSLSIRAMPRVGWQDEEWGSGLYSASRHYFVSSRRDAALIEEIEADSVLSLD